jgi:hypothetical protein
VIAGTEDSVFAFHEGDPHPNCFIRLLLNIECCRRYGKGPWDHLEDSFRETYRIGPSHANHRLIVACERAIKKVADLCLDSKLNAFGGKTLAQAIDPMKVSPEALRKFETTSGSLLNSHAWIHNECLRMLALTGLNIATADDRSIAEAYAQQERWTKILGQTIQSN